MRINKLSSLVGLTAALALGSMAAAQAQSPEIYVGASWGAYSINESDLDENDDVLKLVVGGQLNDWFGVEGSWVDFNRVIGGNDRFESDGKGLAAVFSMPVGDRSSVFLKVGQFWWESDSSLGGTLGASSGNDPFWGAGFKFGFSDHLALRLDAERYEVANANLNAYMVGLEFKF
ncbi:MAG: porin family protein [Gammaproteobacteria bacterium]|nr:porin family protein [Gammaproteobacteria bacterium]